MYDGIRLQQFRYMRMLKYRIRPKYRTMGIGIILIAGKLVANKSAI